VGKENTGLNMEGQTAASDGSSTGSFSANVVNMKNADGKLAGAGVASARRRPVINSGQHLGVPEPCHEVDSK